MTKTFELIISDGEIFVLEQKEIDDGWILTDGNVKVIVWKLKDISYPMPYKAIVASTTPFNDKSSRYITIRRRLV